MCRSVLVIVALLTIGCGDDQLTGPYDGLPLEAELDEDLAAPVHVARDQYGIAHIEAQSLSDLAFAQGYVMAHDRLPQMDILRRYGAGTLSELFGALDPSVIDTDLEMRMHRMTATAEAAWAELQASSDPVDKEVVILLSRFADGVNAYAARIRTEANPDGLWSLDPNLLVSFDPSRFRPWTPVDSLVLGRFQSFALSWTAPVELDLTELYQKLRTTFATTPRAGIERDLLRFTPVGRVSTIDGFPNATSDGGTRSDDVFGGSARPQVPQRVLDDARAFFAKDIYTGPFGTLGPHAFMTPYAGSNNWAVGASRTNGNTALLASDQHLQLPNPSIFYPTHIRLADGSLDVMGSTFPGIPGVILGTNGQLAWSATVSYHDVNDVYAESIVPCGDRDCVVFNGQQVPIERVTETIKIGALGTIIEERQVTYEVVPHHGPIIPTIDRTNHTLAPRTGTTALSVKYTGHQVTHEIRAIYQLARAPNIAQGFYALSSFGYGSQNWTMVDNIPTIGWTTHALVPVRDPRAYAWHATDRPDGAAPFFVLPGDGTAEWTGWMDSRYIPHVAQPESDMIVTANADPVGATFDNDPLGGPEQPLVDGRPLYVGVAYAAGLRHERITTMLHEATSRGGVTIDDMADIQHDTTSTMGTKLTPYIVAALGRLDSPDGPPADIGTYVGALSTADRERLVRARTLLTGWTFATPTGLAEGDSLTDSAATAVFNAWMHFFVERVLGDEHTAIGFPVWNLDSSAIARIVHGILTSPQTFVPSASTNQPILCDVVGGAGPDDSCEKQIIAAALDAMLHLESAAGFGTADTNAWTWGDKHRLKIQPLFPNSQLDLPGPGLPGFPKTGDNFAVNRSDQGWADLDFSQHADGPAQRFLATAEAGNPITVKWALPGGVIFDSRSRHYRDLLDAYYLTETHFDAPFQLHEIVDRGESRWLLR